VCKTALFFALLPDPTGPGKMGDCQFSDGEMSHKNRGIVPSILQALEGVGPFIQDRAGFPATVSSNENFPA